MELTPVPVQVVLIGGGHGLSTMIRAFMIVAALMLLEGYEIILTVITDHTDDGGGTGILRKDYEAGGHLGDAGLCMATLSPNLEIKEALLKRWKGGCLDGNSRKNILLFALESVFEKDPDKGLEWAWKICELGKHRVMPISRQPAILRAIDQNGDPIDGESRIDSFYKDPSYHPHKRRIVDYKLEPSVDATPMALRSIVLADLITIGPGSTGGSVISPLEAVGVKDAFRNSSAFIVPVVNLTTNEGETQNFTVFDFIAQIRRRIGRPVQYYLCNERKIPKDVLDRYRLERKVPIRSCASPDSHRPVVHEDDPCIRRGDFLEVTDQGIRHSPEKLAPYLRKIIKERLRQSPKQKLRYDSENIVHLTS